MRRKTMKMMTVAVLTAILLLAQGCEQPIIPSPSGSGIRFKTSTNWGGDVATKTVYGDVVTDGGLKKQRIDWVVDDHIRIYSDKASFAYDASVHYADYRVERVYSESSHPDVSYATVQPGGLLDGTSSASSQPNGLVWGEGLHKFVSVYPSPADITSEYAGETFALTGGDDASSSISRTFAASLPASQTWTKADMDANRVIKPNMDFAYMYAMAAASAGSEVTLSFKPMFTAFQFTIDSGDDAFMWLKKFTLKANNGALAGKFSATVTVPDSGSGSIAYSYAADDVTDAVELTFLEEAGGTAGIKVVKESPVTFTVFALPVDYEAGMSITVESDGMDGSNQRKTLALKNTSGEWVTFEKCRKYNITLGVPGEWEYVIDDPADITLTYEGGTENLNGAFNSYRRRLDGSQKEKVAYKLQYSTDNGTTWTDGLPTWLTSGSTSNYTGSYNSDDVLSLTIAAQTNSAGTNEHTTALQGATAKSGFDLSTVNVATGATVSRTTANCYVVQASGTYKFPLVYGNGVVGGMVNASAYTGAGSGDNFLDTFVNTNDAAITSPYILTDLGLAAADVEAAIVWTDVPGLIEKSSVTVTGSGDDTYINFKVPQASIRQGNAVIALKKKSDGTILWSWHIWVTDHDLTQTAQAGDYQFAPYNVGWVDGEYFEKYDARNCLVRAVQTPADGATGAASEVATVTQTEKLDYVKDSNPLYQWGRKDPLQTTTGIIIGEKVVGEQSVKIKSKKTWYDADGNVWVDDDTDWSVTWAEEAVRIGNAIRTPYKVYTKSTNHSTAPPWCLSFFLNLWNTGYTSSSDDDTPVIKTVYDPSPVGYKVPNMGAWNYLIGQVSPSGALPASAFTVLSYDAPFLNYSGFTYSGSFFPAIYNFWGYNTVYGTGRCYMSATPFNQATPKVLYLYLADSYFAEGYFPERLLNFGFKSDNSPAAGCLSVRPIKEDASLLFGATTGGQQSGGEYNGSQLNNGWGDGN